MILEIEWARLSGLMRVEFPHRCTYCFATSLDVDGWPVRSGPFGPYAWCGTCTTSEGSPVIEPEALPMLSAPLLPSVLGMLSSRRMGRVS